MADGKRELSEALPNAADILFAVGDDMRRLCEKSFWKGFFTAGIVFSIGLAIFLFSLCGQIDDFKRDYAAGFRNGFRSATGGQGGKARSHDADGTMKISLENDI